MQYKAPLLIVAALAAGCELVGDSGLDLSDVPIATSQTEYMATISADHPLMVNIPFIFDNDSDRPLYVEFYGHPQPPRLEKKVNDEWATAFIARMPECLGRPLTLQPQSVYRDTLDVNAWMERDVRPQFHVEEVPGTYRLMWEVYAGKDGQRVRDLLPLKKRISHTFTITN